MKAIVPKYLEDRYSKTLPGRVIRRAIKRYGSRLEAMGIVPGTEMWEWFIEGKFAFCPCKWDVNISLKGDCSITFGFCSLRTPLEYNDMYNYYKVEVCFKGVSDINCELHDNGGYVFRDYLHSSLWRKGGKSFICITFTSGENDDSRIAFSYKSVSFKDLGPLIAKGSRIRKPTMRSHYRSW